VGQTHGVESCSSIHFPIPSSSSPAAAKQQQQQQQQQQQRIDCFETKKKRGRGGEGPTQLTKITSQGAIQLLWGLNKRDGLACHHVGHTTRTSLRDGW